MKTQLISNRMKWTILGLCLACATFQVVAQTYTITNSTADAMLSGASPTLNFGAAGTLAISPASSPKGEFDTVLMFNTAGAVSQFNGTYGAGNWAITGLLLSFASNLGTNGAIPASSLLNTVSGGNFGINWLLNDSWTEGTGGGNGTNNGAVSFNSIPSLLAPGFDSLGTYTYSPPGNNVYANYPLALDANLVADAAAGGAVSLYFFAADNQIGYLMNSKQFTANRPQFTITVVPTPEPATISLLAAAVGGVLFSSRLSAKKLFAAPGAAAFRPLLFRIANPITHDHATSSAQRLHAD